MKLWPNLGGEEGRVSPALKPGHPLREIARAWALLFGPGTEILAREAGEEESRAWPESLGDEPDRACWPWLECASEAIAWWPDAEARRELTTRGLSLEAPEPATLHGVHDKAFTLEHARRRGGLGGDLADVVTVFEPEQLRDPTAIEETLDRWPDWARAHWALKPRFGSSGRGRVHSTEMGEPDRLLRVLSRLAARGGAILEPWLDRVQDYSVQLMVHADGSVETLGSLHQLVKPGGAVLGGAASLDGDGRSRGAGDLHDELVAAAIDLVTAASARGFRGPCGVDSFAWRDRRGAEHLRSLCELNARFTTGHVAIGCALRALAAGRLGAGEAWRFLLGGGEGLRLAGEGGPSLATES